MIFRGLAATLAAVVFLSAVPAFAQVETYDFDKAHTQIVFQADHLGFSKSHGMFTDFDGAFTIDRGKPENSSVEIVIKTDSIDMNMEKWDEHMKNEDFFNVAKFPEMTFKSTKIEITGENTANMTGDLTLLGVTKPVTLAVTHNKSGPFPFGDKYVAGFSATGTLNRADWGMTYGTPAMGTDVILRIEVEGVRRDAEGQ